MKSRILLLLASLVILLHPGCGWNHTANRAVTSLEDAVTQLEKGVKTFDDLKVILEGLKGNLDNEKYKKQVEDLIRTTGQVAQLSIEGTADFTRTRIVEDLTNIKRTILGRPLLERIPVLAHFKSSDIDFLNDARTTTTIVGWNLDVAANDQSKYKVVIENKNEGTRDVPGIHVSYHGQYAVSVDISKSGVPFKFGDARMSFLGYSAPNGIAIVKSDPPAPPLKITAIRLHVGTTGDNKDKEITFHYTIHRISDGERVGGIERGGGEEWPDPSEQKPHWREFTIPIDSPFVVVERMGYRLHVKYTSSDGDPKWNGRFRADALVNGGNPIPILKETSDFNFGHRDDGNPDDRDFDFNQ